MALQILLFSAAFFAGLYLLARPRTQRCSGHVQFRLVRNCRKFSRSDYCALAQRYARQSSQEKFAGIAKRDLDYVLRESLSKALDYAIDLDIFTGFILLFAFALFFMLSFWRPCGSPELAGPFQFRQKAPLFGLGGSIAVRAILMASRQRRPAAFWVASATRMPA